jgi:hypothetical protein
VLRLSKRSLNSYFAATQERFANAETFEERRELLAISSEIIREALDQIAEQRAQVSHLTTDRSRDSTDCLGKGLYSRNATGAV